MEQKEGSMSENKYKMFRNFMVNELGITKEEIMQWTKESVAEQVSKLFGQMNVVEIIANTVRSRVSNVNQQDLAREVARQFSAKAMEEIVISVNRKGSTLYSTASPQK